MFDIAQTDGDELPEIVTRLQGEDNDDAYGRLVRVARATGYAVEDAEFPDNRHGDCHFALRRIRVASDRSPAQRVKTLAHEVAHALMHEGVTDRAVAELEAESVAYIVCAQLGFDSSDYTFGCVTGWAGGGEEAIAGIRIAGNRIQRGADKILTQLVEPAAAPATTT